MIPVRNKKTDISSEVAKGRKLQEKIKACAEEAAKKSINNSLDLDVVIAEISKREKFNRLQIQRLVEEGNTVTYNKRYDKLRSSNDRRITFPLASLDGVVEKMGSDAPPEIHNPNFSTGGQGGGEMNKAASEVEPTYIHNPNARLQERYDKFMSKVASTKQRQEERETKQQLKEEKSTIFKIANSLVWCERQYKNSNEVFNTLLSDVSLSPTHVDEIIKTASVIGEQMVKTKRSHAGFLVSLKENPEEKIASHLLGEFSLLKEAEQQEKTKEVKVQPTVDVADFDQLVTLARKLEKQQIQSLNTDSEVTK